MGDSVIIASVRNIIHFIIWLYGQSAFKKGLDRMGSRLGCILENSYVFQMLWSKDHEEWRQGSKLHQWWNHLQYIGEVKLKHLSRWFEEIYKKSFFGRGIENYKITGRRESVGLLAISLVSMGISSLGGLYIKNQLTKTDVGILGLFLILSVVLYFLRAGLWIYIKNSFLFQFLCRFFWISLEDSKKENMGEEGTFIYYVFHCLIGIGLGGLYIFLPTKLFGLAVGAILGAIVILYDYRIGIYGLIGLFPFVQLTEFALLLLFVIASYLFYSVRKGTFGLGKRNHLLIPLVLFVLNLVISAFTALVPGGSMYGLKVNFIALLFSIFFLMAVKDKKTLYRAIMAFVLSAAVVSLIGIMQYGMPQNAAWTDTELNPEITSRVVGTFGNPNVFGQYLVLAIPFILAMIFALKDRLNQLALWGVFVLAMVALVLTYSRGSYVGFAVAVGLFVWVTKKELIFAGIPFLLIAPYFLPSSLIQRISTIGNALQDSSVQHRILVWKGTLDMVKEFGWYGIGPGGDAFRVIYPLYMVGWRKAAHPHDMFIQYILEFGIIGLGLLVYMVWKLFKTNLKSRNNLLMVASGVSIMGLLMNGLVEGLFFAKIILGFWMCIAFSGKIGELLEKSEELP